MDIDDALERISKISGRDLIKTFMMRNHKKIILALFLGIILFAAVYEIVFVEGPSYFGDDTVYIFYANQAAHGHFVENTDVFSLRILNILPISFFFELFGINNLTVAAWSIVSFIGCLVVAFYLGRELYNDHLGILAALLLAFFPLFAVLSGTPSPNIPEAFLTGFAFLALIRGEKHNSKYWYFASGISLVLSILATPASGIIFFVIGIYLLIEFLREKIKIDKISIFWLYGIGFAGTLLMAYNYATAGNPFITVLRTAEVYSTVGTPVEGVLVNTDLTYYFGVMFPYHIFDAVKGILLNNISISSIWQSIYVPSYNYVGFCFYAFLFCVAYLMIMKEKRAYVPILWTAVGFLLLEFGPIYISLVPFRYMLTHRLERYLTIIGIPVMMVIAMAIVNIIERSLKSKKLYLTVSALVFALFLVVTDLPISQMWYNIVKYSTFDQMTISNYLAAFPNNTKIYLESGFSIVTIYMGYSNMSRMYVYDNIRNCKDIPSGSYVILPKFIRAFNLNYTPDPSISCPSWNLVLFPQISGTYAPFVTGPSYYSAAKLYYVP